MFPDTFQADGIMALVYCLCWSRTWSTFVAGGIRTQPGHSYWETADGSKRLEEEGFVFLPLCFVRCSPGTAL